MRGPTSILWNVLHEWAAPRAHSLAPKPASSVRLKSSDEMAPRRAFHGQGFPNLLTAMQPFLNLGSSVIGRVPRPLHVLVFGTMEVGQNKDIRVRMATLRPSVIAGEHTRHTPLWPGRHPDREGGQRATGRQPRPLADLHAPDAGPRIRPTKYVPLGREQCEGVAANSNSPTSRSPG